ncbi:hypothetical protein ACFQ21_00505 [Ohtaekwangia kribbensis]|jgi:hypothetical protein|uniref:General stress protein CsbD n=1 Tax=Ohtaekwangia kribbensis TaxID=688913 RepID=A0ABW3JUZ4_9BACT
MNDKKNPEELWAMQKAKLKLIFAHLHEDDFQYDYGKKDVMLKNLELKLGKSREELEQLLLGL